MECRHFAGALLRGVQMSATTFNWIIAFVADKACGVVPVAA
jgi:hypothetical protein